MKLNMNKEELKETAQDARRALDRERERMVEEVERVDGLLRVMDATDELLAEIDHLNEKVETRDEEMENLRQQLQEEKDLRVKAEMQLNEMSKLSASMAGKASHDAVLKALRVFVNKSKHKKLEKRIMVKDMVLEIANANGIVLPEDLAATIDSLDDEHPEAKVVNVAGNYNDIHDNGNVNRA